MRKGWTMPNGHSREIERITRISPAWARVWWIGDAIHMIGVLGLYFGPISVVGIAWRQRSTLAGFLLRMASTFAGCVAFMIVAILFGAALKQLSCRRTGMMGD